LIFVHCVWDYWETDTDSVRVTLIFAVWLWPLDLTQQLDQVHSAMAVHTDLYNLNTSIVRIRFEAACMGAGSNRRVK
jgi:hypothetical protein